MNGTQSHFSSQRNLPDVALTAQAGRLIGFPARYGRISGHLRLLTDLEGVRRWVDTYHRGGDGLVSTLGDRYPFVVFHGDVGTGKTATAEAASNALAADFGGEGFLLKLSSRVRGIGHVGEMSTLIADAFAEARTLAGKARFVALIIDEGDALAFNRGLERAHHEDRAGVNALIQQIDDARALGGRLLIFLCTNRFSALDPAVLRRASLVEEFRRPDDTERRELLEADLVGVDVSSEILDELIAMTGPRKGRPGYTFSDIQTRLLPGAIARAYPHRALTAEDLLVTAAEVEPSPVMRDADE